MFWLHETTRIRLCRRAFVVLCVLPTCAVLAWCAFVNGPIHRRLHEQALARQLGWHVRLAQVTSPRPGLTLYEELELTDPEAGQLLARLPFVEVQTTGDAITIKLPFPSMVNGTRLATFWRLAHEQLRDAHEWRQLRIEAQNVTLHLSDGDQSFTQVRGELDNAEHQAQLKLNFCRATAGDAPVEPAELSILRNRQSTPPASVIQFHTGGTPLPCALVASVWPGVESLGTASTFAGKVSAAEASGPWKAEFSGRVSGIDLDLLMGQFPHKLSGPAEATLERVNLQDGRVESAIGTLVAGPGVISRSLIHSAQANLHVQLAPEAVSGAENRPHYKQLHLAFNMAEGSLALTGEIPDQKGALLVDVNDRVLARQPDVVNQPVVNLVRTLVPQTAVQVPATRETDGLTRFLPVPSIVTPAGSETPLPQAKALRLGPRRK